MDTPLDNYSHALAGTLATGIGDTTLGVVPGDFSFPDAPDGATVNSATQQATFKSAGDTEKTGVAIGQATAEGSRYGQWAPGAFQGQVKGDASAMAVTAHAQQDWTTKHKTGHFAAEETFEAGAMVHGEAGALLDKNTIKAILHTQAEARVGEQASVSAEQTVGDHLSAAGKGEVNSGAWASVDATAAFDPKKGTAMIKAGVSTFAGAEEKVQGGVEAGGVGFSAGIGVSQGVGYELKFGAGVKDGVVSASVDASAALGFGGTVAFGVSLDTKEVAGEVKEGLQAMMKTPSAKAHEIELVPLPWHHSAKALAKASAQSSAKAPSPPAAPRHAPQVTKTNAKTSSWVP